MAFWGPLAALAPYRVDFVPQDTMGLPDLETAIGDALPGTAVYACGPAGMLEAVEALANKCTDRVTLQIERFTAADAAAPRRVIPSSRSSGREPARCSPSRRTRQSSRPCSRLSPTTRTRVPKECVALAKRRFLRASHDHRDQASNDFERSTNETMMICCGRSLTKRLVLDL